MTLHTITWNDTVSELYAKKKTKKWKDIGFDSYETIWKHKINKILRQYWPEGVETSYKRLPVGYSIWFPSEQFIQDAIDQNKNNRTFVKKPELNDLRLKVDYYKTYEKYIWSPKQWREDFLRKHFLTQDELEKKVKQWKIDKVAEVMDRQAQIAREVGHSVGGAYTSEWKLNQAVEAHPGLNIIDSLSGETIKPGDTVYYYIENPKKKKGNKKDTTYIQTKTPIEEFLPTSGYTIPIPSEKEWPGIRGNNKEVDSFTNGYVYIFKGDTPKPPFELIKTYKVTNGTYHQVTLSKSDDHTSTGVSGAYIEIKNFFNAKDPYNREKYKFHYIYTSPVPLTWRGITETDDALCQTVHKIGKLLPQAAWLHSQKDQREQREQRKTPLDIVKAHENYQQSNGNAPAIDVLNHDFDLKMEQGEEFLYFHAPHVEQEVRRLNNQYIEQYQTLIEWRDCDTERAEKAFLYTIVNQLLEKGNIGRNDVDYEKLTKTFPYAQDLERRRLEVKTDQALEELIQLLEHQRFRALLEHYSERAAAEHARAGLQAPMQESPGDIYEEQLQCILADAVAQLNCRAIGYAFLQKEVTSPNSVYNLVVSGLVKNKTMPPELVCSETTNEIINAHLLTGIRKTTDDGVKYVTEFLTEVVKTQRSNKKALSDLSKFFRDNYFSKKPELPPLPEGFFNQLETAAGGKKLIFKEHLIDLYSPPGQLRLNKKFTEGPIDDMPLKAKVGTVVNFLEVINTALLLAGVLEKKEQAAPLDTNDFIGVIGGFLGLSANLVENGVAPFECKLFTWGGRIQKMVKTWRYFPLVGMVSSVIDAWLSACEAWEYMEQDECVVALSYAFQAIGFSLLAIAGATKTSLPLLGGLMSGKTAAGPTIGTITGLVGVAVVLATAAIIYAWDTEVEEWVKAGFFGSKSALDQWLEKNISRSFFGAPERTLSEQIQWILKWLVTFKIQSVWKSALVYEDYISEWLISVNPRMLSSDAVLTVENLAVKGVEKAADVRFYPGAPNPGASRELNPFQQAFQPFELKPADFISDDQQLPPIYYQDRFDHYQNFSEIGRVTCELESELRQGKRQITWLTIRLQFKKRVTALSGRLTLKVIPPRDRKMMSENLQEKYGNLSCSVPFTG